MSDKSGIAVMADVSTLPEHEDALLLADIEARLTEEVHGLIRSIEQFGLRSKLISEEIPNSSKFAQLIASTLTLSSFHFAYALRKGADKGIFFYDTSHDFGQFSLSLEDRFRQINLDGRKFLAVALIDE